MAKRSRYGQYGGDPKATAIKLSGNVPLEDIERAIEHFELKEDEIANEISKLIVQNAPKKEIETERVKYIRIGAMADILVVIAGGRSHYEIK